MRFSTTVELGGTTATGFDTGPESHEARSRQLVESIAAPSAGRVR